LLAADLSRIIETDTAPIWFAVQINDAHIVQHKSLSVNSEEATLSNSNFGVRGVRYGSQAALGM
jgi:hypothetical protein